MGQICVRIDWLNVPQRLLLSHICLHYYSILIINDALIGKPVGSGTFKTIFQELRPLCSFMRGEMISYLK